MYTGAMTAAKRILFEGSVDSDDIAAIIAAETHEAEMIAFVERVAAWEYTCVSRAQEEAFALLKKVRG